MCTVLIAVLLFWILVLLELCTGVIAILLAVIIIILIRLIIVLWWISALRTIVITHDFEVLKESNRIHGHICTTSAIFSNYTEIDRLHHVILWLNLPSLINFARFNDRRSEASLLIPKPIITTRICSHIHIFVRPSWSLLLSDLFLEKPQELDLNLVFEPL